MKFRQEKGTREEDERALADAVRALDAPGVRDRVPGPADPYWQNLLVRTNSRIDRATSGKALSISWAARVAIPGVIAIVSFLVALHYYVPEPPAEERNVAEVLNTLPDQSIDSLMSDASLLNEALTVENVSQSVFAVTADQAADYFIENDKPVAVLESMTDDQLAALERELRTRLH